jgi:hypothetical protein
LRNVSENTGINGYFVGTCYDGETVFKKLAKTPEVTIYSDGRKIFEIQRKYEQTGFPADETSVGYAIDVFQESINKYATEYLVHFGYLVRVMEDYGFVLAGAEELQINNSDMFETLYNKMMYEVKKYPESAHSYGKAPLMTAEEKTISFMNRYFVFKKIRSVDAARVYKQLKSAKVEEVSAIAEAAIAEANEPKPENRVRRICQVILEKYEPIDLGEVVVLEDKGKPDALPEVLSDAIEEDALPEVEVEGDKGKKPRCKTGTRRYKPLGPDCYTDEQIAAHKTRKRV